MKILVSGLCLSRNLGGPAMGLTLIDEIDRRVGEKNEYIFAVSAVDFEAEKEWATRYGLQVVPRAELEAYITHFTLYRYITRVLQGKSFQYLKNAFRFWQKTWGAHTKAIKEADIVINMEGVSYIGDGTRGYWEGINSFTTFLLAKIYRKKYARFIQSFGPLSRFDVNFFAKIELKNLPFVPARGKASAKDCATILNSSEKVYDFPDSAILLKQAPKEWKEGYLAKKGLQKKGYVILSPSSVVYSIASSKSKTSKEEYLDYFVKMADFFLEQGEKILFLPHMYSEKKSECDREVARKIVEKLPKDAVFLVEDDLDPMEAKALISASKFALVSRYHALVAALSSDVDVIALGWNIKYHDLMEYYGVEEFALDSRYMEKDALFVLTKERYFALEALRKEKDFENLQKEASKRVAKAFDMLVDWMEQD